MTVLGIFSFSLWLPVVFFAGCGLFDDSLSKRPSNSGLIATPVTYYSTSRARYLGTKYKDNLDRMVEKVVRNPKTSSLQFANNISSVGGIGFYTHSVTKTADERFLELVMAVPETFESKGAHSDKVSRLFTLYGSELLAILTGDSDIYQDKELAGYGLNLAWRSLVSEAAGNRVVLERAIVYLSKEKSRGFLRREISQNELLANATIFAVEEDGPLNLVSYRAPEVRPELAPAIREDDIAPAPSAPTKRPDSPDQIKKESLPFKEPVAKAAPPKPPLTVAQNNKPLPLKPPVPASPPAKPAVTKAAIAPAPEVARAVVVKLEAPTAEIVPAVESKAELTPETPLIASAAPAPVAVETIKPIAAPKVLPVPMVVAPPATVAPEPILIGEATTKIPAKPIETTAPILVTPPPVVLNLPASEAPSVEIPAAPKPPSVVQSPLPQTMPRPITANAAALRPDAPSSPPLAIAKAAPPAIEVPTRMTPPVAAPIADPVAVKPAAEQLALLTNRPQESAPAKPAVVRPAAPKALEGFIIQLAFNDKDRAQRWAEGMEKKGFAVSVTEAGAEGALRVRLGNFVVRDDAERQLRAIKQEGLSGIILNLPQGFRPEARSSIP